MKVGIIGSGRIGGTMARRLTALGHDVSIANSRGPATLVDLAAETGATPTEVAQVAAGADLVVVAIPEKSVPQLPAGLLDAAAADVVVVDAGNYSPQRDGRIDAIEQGTTESRWVADQLGHTVVKTFNTMYANRLLEGGRPADDPDRFALPFAGDDAAAKAVVAALLDDLGFDAVDAGSLDESWRQQPGSPVYGAAVDATTARTLLAQATSERSADLPG